jgi:lipoprotein NlpD
MIASEQADRGMRSIVTWLALMFAASLVVGCTSAPVPVSERDVRDYRRASSPPATSETKPATSSRTAPAPVTEAKPQTPVTAAAPPAATKPPANASTATAGEAVEDGDWRPETYTVKRGDTLYSIALDHGLDYKELASWNQLADANVIKVGQQLKLRAPPGWKPEAPESDEVIARPLPPAEQVETQALEMPVAPKSQPKGVKVPYSDRALAQITENPAGTNVTESKPAAPEPKPQPKAQPEPKPVAEPKPAPEPKPMPEPRSAPEPKTAAAESPKPAKIEPVVAKPAPKYDDKTPDSALQWAWPASGKLVHGFAQGSNPKGVAIRGNPGQPVFATAAGKVVYSGSGLRGYGKLVIIKHNANYLSVYAHNRELLVKEGERVSKGQKIAEMGGNSADGIALHFEIRRLGKPVDPLKYLPQEGGA